VIPPLSAPWLQGTYCGPPPQPGGLWAAWNLDPLLIASLVALAWVMRRSPAGLAGVAVLVVAFVSPLCALSAALFSARVVHHVLLIAVAAPLLALAFPATAARGATVPFVLATVVLWLWHLPVAYDLALGNLVVYWLMQASLLATAVWFWRRVLHPRQSAGAALGATFAAFVQMAMLGALLTLAPTQLYAIHAIAPMDWGFTPLTDQQLGGLIMWMPAGLPYLVIGGILARRSWRAMGRAA
jgi:putative membrane protein